MFLIVERVLRICVKNIHFVKFNFFLLNIRVNLLDFNYEITIVY